MKRIIVAGLALAAAGGIGYAAGAGNIPSISTLNPKAMKLILPENIKWGPAAGLTGTDSYTLVGDPGKPGFYVVLNRFHPGNFSHPHYHSNDRSIMVLSGTWWVGQGVNWDPEHVTAPVKPGTFVTHYARQVHYDGARKEDAEPAVELVWGMGPVATIPCDGPNAEKGPGPCDDARKAEK